MDRVLRHNRRRARPGRGPFRLHGSRGNQVDLAAPTRDDLFRRLGRANGGAHLIHRALPTVHVWRIPRRDRAVRRERERASARRGDSQDDGLAGLAAGAGGPRPRPTGVPGRSRRLRFAPRSRPSDEPVASHISVRELSSRISRRNRLGAGERRDRGGGRPADGCPRGAGPPSQVTGGEDRGLQLFGICRQTRGRGAWEAERCYAARFLPYAKWMKGLSPAERRQAALLRSYAFYRFLPGRIKILDEREFGGAMFVTAAVVRRPQSRTVVRWSTTELLSP